MGGFPRVRVGLIHATPLAVEPVTAAFAAHWPAAAPMNILDNALTRDRGDGAMSPAAVIERILALAAYARLGGCAGILFTCSAFGPAIEHATANASVPVLKPNEAMFRDAIAKGRRLSLIATFAMALPTLVAEFEDEKRRLGSNAELRSVAVSGAMEALSVGDIQRHDGLIAAAAVDLADCDALMLAQFSMARAADSVRQAVKCPVLTSPVSAVQMLRGLVDQSGS
jgi:Asp/Glu/hydantoin racemase